MTAASARSLDENQVRQLLAIPRELDATQPPRGLLQEMVGLVARVAHAKAAILVRRDSGWVLLAESALEPALPLATAPEWQALATAADTLGARVVACHVASICWTLVGLRDRPAAGAVLLLEGDWRPSATELVRFSRGLILPDTKPAPRRHSQLAVQVHRLARALSRVSGEREVCETVLKHVVRALRCRIGALAVPDDAGFLRVTATYGYSRTLVEHLRIAPGSGVFGSVFSRRAPLRVLDVTTHPTIGHRRSRYRTDSFVAVPLVAGSEVLAVLALTDKASGGVFTRDDLSILRALVAPASLAMARERHRRQAERHALSAAIDPVSGLYNRRYFKSRLEEELQRSRRTGSPVALLMLDIDDFKSINDRFGHVAGDTVISDVAEILRHSVRAFDVCARYGGEEFAVLMPSHGPESAATTAERIRQRIEEHRLLDPSLEELRVTASFGIAVAQGGTGVELVERADRALYGAKRAGKNQVRVHPMT